MSEPEPAWEAREREDRAATAWLLRWLRRNWWAVLLGTIIGAMLVARCTEPTPCDPLSALPWLRCAP